MFDQANPSNESRKLYYEFLKDLISMNCLVIITGGNHDSPGILNAPKDILNMLQVYVVGNVPDQMEDEVFEFLENGEIGAVVCAVPYIREPDIHRFTEGETFDDKRKQVSAGIRNHFTALSEYCTEKYDPSIPVIAMGHLYAAGATTSESEREIQIGYQSPVTADDFPERFDYVALGHIHRPQFVAQQTRIRYSGSPIALSFSEKNDKKIVIELEITADGIEQTSHPVPAFRKLVKFTGTFDEVKTAVESFKNNGDARAWAELQIVEETVTPAIQSAVSNFVADFDSEEIEILNHRITSTSAPLGIIDMVDDHTQLEDLKPNMVLAKMMESESFTEEQRAMIMQAFIELQEMEEGEEDE
jgi:exonuclease SbcD